MHYRIEKRKYIYRYRDESRKYKRVPMNSYAQPKNEKEAETLLKQLAAKYDARFNQVKQQEAWHEKYYNFKSLVIEFEKFRSSAAPNSWKSKRHWFTNYVLDYFLNLKSMPNLNEWKFEFKKFKYWLEHEATKKRIGEGDKLAYASMNHIINELNCFLALMAENGKCDIQPKLRLFPESKLDNEKTSEDIVPHSEFQLIHNAILQMNALCADLYEVLYHTGMRFNEALGLSINDLKKGMPPHPQLIRLLNEADLSPIHGYILLSQQPKYQKPNPKTGKYEYKALKGKPRISDKHTRYIPIINKNCFNTLVKLYKTCKQSNSEHFFLGKITNSIFSRLLTSAYVKCKINYKSPHHLRHTKATEIYRQSMSQALAKLILGHSSKTTDRYLHLVDEMIKRSKNNENSEDLEFVS